ncbi:MAG: shikimate dehydrogenase [Abditibacteriota bacterium]|nr:shikimate dehydrogenase [Abditibacteriota bacterium]
MITSHTKSIAIIGDPIEHSLTPRIQNHALQKLGADIVNIALRVTPDDLAIAVRGAQALGFLGLMVTIPHKEKVLLLCDRLDESARLMGAANLLHFQPDGSIVGYSSDGWAAVKSLQEEGATVRDARIAILGGGGAARSLALTFAREGAHEIILLNRTIERAQLIADEVKTLHVPARATTLDKNTLRQVLPEVDLLVNATSIGMHPNHDETPVAQEALAAHLTVYDIVYNPLETRLLREAKSVGARVVDGLGMLIYTNVRAIEICAAQHISAATMREEAMRALASRA